MQQSCTYLTDPYGWYITPSLPPSWVSQHQRTLEVRITILNQADA